LDACQNDRVIPAARARRSPVDKFDERRNELAEAALLTLGQLGYARTGLRDIASNSPYSHGVLHYYFQDKTELVCYTVRYHKARCVTRYDDVVAGAASEAALLQGVAAKLVEAVLDEAPAHRLWYDLRVQSMFDERLRDTVLAIDQQLEDMVWRIVSRYSELAGRPAAMDRPSAYAVFDGLFQAALLGYSAGDEGALPRLVTQVPALLPMTLCPVSNAVDVVR
jgi:TetR/AcrR family transcriptional regulator, transcriptional repressor of bet genes